MLARLGFDGQQLRFALRTALAAFLALLVAWMLGLEHPQWSAMTVWAASQPTRGQLLEKSFFRFAGTVSGCIAGVALVVVSHGEPWMLVAGLALWVGLCAAIGNLQRGFVSYGTMLAGYSAAMVALLDSAHPEHVEALAADRLLTVLVGVVLALLVNWLFTPPLPAERLNGGLRAVCAHTLRSIAAGCAEGHQAIFAEMGAIEEALDPHGAGSWRSRQSVRAIRRVLLAAMAGLTWSHRAGPLGADVGAALLRAAVAVEQPDGDLLEALERAEKASFGHPALRTALGDLRIAWADYLGQAEVAAVPPPSHPVVLHRDWVGAREALIRSAGALLAAGGVWVATGWSGGAFMMLGLSIMLSVFSAMENPAHILRFVLLGTVLGGTAAFVCHWLVWPLAPDELGQILLTTPFMLAGAFFVAHQPTRPAGFDYNMSLLLLLRPDFPLIGDMGQSLTMTVSVILAPAIALLAYRLVFPTDARRRQDTLIAMMVRELQDMASLTGTADRRIWRARLYHRLLRLVRWADRHGERDVSVTGGSLAVLALGSAILRLRELLADRQGLRPGAARRLQVALRRAQRLAGQPAKVAAAFEQAAARLSAADAERVRTAAVSLTENRRFFERAS